MRKTTDIGYVELIDIINSEQRIYVWAIENIAKKKYMFSESEGVIERFVTYFYKTFTPKIVAKCGFIANKKYRINKWTIDDHEKFFTEFMNKFSGVIEEELVYLYD